jgi:hypothetical protein
VAAIAASLLASIALADNVRDDITVNPAVKTVTAGGAGAVVRYGIQANNAGGSAGFSGCDASDGTPVTLTPVLPAGITATPASLTLTTCPDETSAEAPTITYAAGAATPGGMYPITITATDAHGNYGTDAAAFSLVVPDHTPPVITPVVAGTAGFGTPPWYTSDVNVTWTVADAESTVSSKSAPCTTTTSITTDTIGQTVTCTATSAGGTDTRSVTIRRDATKPTLSPVVTPDAVPVGGSATVDANADGGVSGLLSSSCNPIDSTTVGAKTVTCTATDNAGNTDSATASYVVYDNTPPVVEASIAGTAGTSPWYTSDVDVTWTVTDGESAISTKSAACDTTTTISTDTAGQEVTCSATSAGGTTTKKVTIKRDATPPTLAPTVSPSQVAVGGAATASANADGGVSGLASSSCDPVDTSIVGTRTVTCTATDGAGNVNTGTASYTVYDPTPPVITASVSGTEGLGSPPWYTSDVDVTWTVTDGESAIGFKSLACDTTTSITADTTGQTVSCTATSAGGTGTRTVTIRRDATKPTLSPTVTPSSVAVGGSATAAANADGGVSGLLSSSCDPVDTSTVGAKTVACTATDNAGNVNTGIASYTVTDPTPPVVTATVTGTEGNGTPPWYTSDVTVTWTVTDPESPISSKSAACDVTTSITTDTAGQNVTCSATSAGGTTSVTETIRRDATKPTLTPTVTPNPVALNGSATASPNANGGVSGLLSSSCDPVDTSTVGTKTVTCTATDNAGNTNTGSATYTVGYNFTGFFQPVDNLPTLNTAKAGSAIPVKFSLGGNFGLNVMFIGYPSSKVVACDASPGDAVEQTSTAGNSSLQYDALTGQYTYVWKTDKSWANTCRQLVVKLADGTSRAANFKLK